MTPAQVAAQVAEAARLRSDLTRTDARIAALGEQLAAAASRASAALELVRTTSEAAAAATVTLDQERHRLDTLVLDAARSRRDLGRWARDAYVAGGPVAAYDQALTVLSRGSTGDVGHDLAVLTQVGVVDSATLDRLQAAAASQQSVVASAAQAARRSVQAQQAAAAAKKDADRLLAQQLAVLAELQAQQARTVDRARTTQDELGTSTDATARAAAARLAAALASPAPGVSSPIVGSGCPGLSTAAYANGEIPAAALCPLRGRPGQLLRADAAAAFNRLSRAYEQAFGQPLCVTDSYRSRAEQVAVYAAKPTLAARPGRSNHGWGTAVDLCGGIESFGTVQHAWLLSRGPVYGWFHPVWAEPGGSRPEPWHWEFAG